MTVRALALLLALTSAASAETPKERAERLISAKAGTILPKWYQPVTPIVCVSYCKNGITSSTFELVAVHTETGKSVPLAIYCDDVPDKHQCGWGVRH